MGLKDLFFSVEKTEDAPVDAKQPQKGATATVATPTTNLPLPVVVQRIYDVPDVYQQTAFTLGATKLQTIVSVFIPAVISKLMDDIRVLVAISWTYIIVAEMVNKSAGIGGMIYTFARQGRIDKVFALLFLIILVGFIQDKLFAVIDKQLFPYKHTSEV